MVDDGGESSGEDVEVMRRYSRAQLLALARRPASLALPTAAALHPALMATIFPNTVAVDVRARGQEMQGKEVGLLEAAINEVEGEDLESLLLDLVRRVEAPREDEGRVASLCSELRRVLAPEFPSVAVEPYGSRASGLGLRTSDLDVFVMLGESREDEEFNTRARMWGAKVRTRKIADLLYSDGSQRFRSAQAILRAKTPIVRVKDRVSALWCDLSTSSRMAVVNSAFVRFCCEVEPRARALLVVVKVLGERGSLTGSGRGDHLSSYCLTILVIFYLQVRGLLHSVAQLQGVQGLQEELIEGYNFAFCRDLAQLPPLATSPDTVADLLRGFLAYFARFTFGNQAVCPLVGEPVLTYSLRNGAFLPPSLEAYAAGRARDRLKMDKVMVVQDPFELRRNIGARVSPRRLRRLVQVFRRAGRPGTS